jgi:hypothetical protein
VLQQACSQAVVALFYQVQQVEDDVPFFAVHYCRPLPPRAPSGCSGSGMCTQQAVQMHTSC